MRKSLVDVDRVGSPVTSGLTTLFDTFGLSDGESMPRSIGSVYNLSLHDEKMMSRRQVVGQQPKRRYVSRR